MNAPIATSNRQLSAALAEAEEDYIRANPQSARLHALAKNALPGGNTRTTLHFSPFPLSIRSGSGGEVTDVDGHSYVDWVNEYTAAVFGHSHPVIAQALARAIGDGLNLGGPGIHEHELAAEITRRFASMERLRFCNSGTEANLLALATARAITSRPAALVFEGAYHGSLLYFSHGASPLNMPIPFVISRYNDAKQAGEDIARNASRLAAVLVEPLQGGAGAIPGDPAFLARLRELCSRHGILLIFDEVMTSRLSYAGMQGRLGISPDMTTLGKYVGGGVSIGAFGGRADIMARFDPAVASSFPHGGTFNNNALAMAAGLAGFTRLLGEEALDRMNGRGDGLRRRVNEFAEQRGLAFQATGIGSIFGLHFHRGPIRNLQDLDAGEHGREAAVAALKKLFHLDMFARGHYITRRILGNLSLLTSDRDVESLLAAIEEFLDSRGALIREVVA